mmetsp:Transcript_29120/g.70899  ORF Transcript_29120/g.70899 Transcript_29120/m.70899 type:complete len:99 (+) Transcript_29120:95-391(+)
MTKRSKIRQYLITEYGDEVLLGIKDEFIKWIDECMSYDTDSMRLLYCIAIETKNRLCKKEEYVAIFNKIEYASTYKPQLKFENATNDNKAKLHFFPIR